MNRMITCALCAAMLSLWAACAPQAPMAEPQDIWDGQPSTGGAVNAAGNSGDNNDNADDVAPPTAQPLSAAELLENPMGTLDQLDQGTAFEESPDAETPPTANPSEALPPLGVAEAVDLVAGSLGEFLGAMDPFRNLLGSGADFSAMPSTGLAGDCPAVAYVATDDSAAWALAVDFEFHPDRDANDPPIECFSEIDPEKKIAGVVGLLRSRDSVTARVVAENYTVAGQSVSLSGEVEASGASDDEVELMGLIQASFNEKRFGGEQTLSFNVDGSVLLAGSATLESASHPFELSLLNVRSNPLGNMSLIPHAGGIQFELETGEQVSILFTASTPENGAVNVIVDSQPAMSHIVAGWETE